MKALYVDNRDYTRAEAYRLPDNHQSAATAQIAEMQDRIDALEVRQQDIQNQLTEMHELLLAIVRRLPG